MNTYRHILVVAGGHIPTYKITRPHHPLPSHPLISILFTYLHGCVYQSVSRFSHTHFDWMVGWLGVEFTLIGIHKDALKYKENRKKPFWIWIQKHFCQKFNFHLHLTDMQSYACSSHTISHNSQILFKILIFKYEKIHKQATGESQKENM